MRKQLLNLKFLLMLCMIFCIGGGNVALAEKTSNLTFTAACKGSGTADDNVEWEITSDADESNFDSTRGIHYGTGSAAVSYLTLTTSGITGSITKIVVNASGASKTSAKLDVTVGGTKFGNQASLTSTATEYTFEGNATGEIVVKLSQTSATKALYVKSITVTYTKSTSPTLNSTESLLSFSNVETGSDKDLTFKLTGSNLTADAVLSITGNNADMFSVNPSSVSHIDGTISETPITVKYKPTSTGDHTATLNIKSGEEASATVALSGKGIAHYTVSWKVNGADYNEGNPSTDVIDGSKVTSLPTPPSSISGKVFVGWTDEEISKSQDNAPLVLFNTAPSAPAVTANTTYYAVFASLSEGAPVETLSQTLAYDTWTYKGSTTGKKSYRLFHTDSYIESAEFDLSTLSKVVVYGGTYGGDKYNKLNIGDGTNTWKDVTVSGNSEEGVNTYTGGTPLSGTGKLRITSKSGTASGNGSGVRISKVEIYNTQCGYTYSGYATTINTATLTGISVLGDAADLWTGDDFTHEGITVTATYDNGSTADVTSSCTYEGYNMSTAGSQTVTVSYGGKEATYTVNVNTIGNTQENAYTATEAIGLIDARKGLKTPVYVKGIVSEIVTAFSSEYGNISFNVSENGTTEGDQFLFYRNFKDANNVKYNSENECPKVGDEVIGYGMLTKYNTTYEFSEGNYLVEKIVSTDPSSNLTLSKTTGEVNVDKTLDISGYVSTATGYTETVTYDVTAGSEYASVNAEGVITGLAVGTATVKVTAPAIVGSFSESSAEFTVTVVDNRTATNVTFGEDVDGQTFSVNLGGTFESKTATVTPTEAGNVTYSSDNKDVASVDENGAITLGRIAGTATITASFAATDDYKASSAKYYINVIDPNGPVFYESFDHNKGEGGNDGTWSNISQKPTLMYDNSGWADENENGSGADKCAIFGISSAKGTATTPAIDLSGDKYILTFKAGAWDATREKTTIDVKISKGTLTYNGTSSSTQTIEMNKAKWTDYTMTIAGATNNATITFTAKDDKNNRFFLDEVKIVKAQAPATSTLSLVAVDNKIYYATFSSSEDVIFPSNVEVDAVSVEGSTLNIKELEKDDYFVKATSADGFDVVSNGYYVPANTGVLIQSLTKTVTYYYPYEEAAVSLPTNQLKAAPAKGGVFIAETGYQYYKLAYNNYDEKTGLGFYLGAADGGAFSVKAGTAYLAVPPTSGSAVKGFSFDGTSTGISAVDAEEPAKTRVIYNIAGQKVNAMTKAGLYIVNGKKIVIRK